MTAFYFASTDKNIEKLQELLRLLNTYGYAHEEKIEEIELVMSKIYMDETRQVLIRDGAIEGDDDETSFSVPVLELLDLAEDKEQLVQDYRNVIAEIIWAESYDYDCDEVADIVIEMRDAESYKACIMKHE